MTSEKIESFLSQLPSADKDKVVEIICSITEAPGLFVFGEFLDHPKIQSLEGSAYSSYLDLLNLFCYGSYECYATNVSKYPALRPAQIRKLKQLSIIDEAHNQKRIPYSLLFQKLGFDSSRELEDLVIELFYLEAITGKLNQQKALLEIDSAIGRDIREEQLPELNRRLDAWCSRVESVLNHMVKEIKLASDRRYESELHQKEVSEASLAIKEALRGQIGKPSVHSHQMDVDDVLIHPDLLSDTRLDSSRQSSSNVDSSCGDRDVRNKMTVFKNLRYGKTTK